MSTNLHIEDRYWLSTGKWVLFPRTSHVREFIDKLKGSALIQANSFYQSCIWFTPYPTKFPYKIRDVFCLFGDVLM